MSERQGIIRPSARVCGGIAVPHRKNTAALPLVRVPVPDRVFISMQQHIGAPCEPLVSKGDTVYVGQKIGDCDKPVSSPVHASISGTVKSIKNIMLQSGAMSKAIEIESDGNMTPYEGIRPPVIHSKDDFLKAVRESGLVGLGGAGFPAHIKLAIPPEKNVDTIIINAAECEPYITVDYRQCVDGADDVIDGLLVVRENLGLKNAYIAIEDNKPDAISLIRKKLNESGHTDVHVVSLPSRYPQGAEKVLIHSVTGRFVRPGKLPADAGCLVMNVGSAAFLSRYVKTGKPLVSRSMTVDGTAIRYPKNVRVPIGIELSKIVEFCGGYTEDPERLLIGGPMMGRAMPGDSFAVVKNNNALLAFAPGTLTSVREDACIRCGRCVANCPMHLMPTIIEKYMRLKDKEGLQASGAMICMECGSCAFMCPARRPLVQYMRESKALLRKFSAKK